ncbi:threonylcarbamoyl-AMP synthase [Candidatus Saccharibacteria bacterium]|nr:threonylcarbamoyl-AMP synthase [Candidatus Saccharibacteria bacterium]
MFDEVTQKLLLPATVGVLPTDTLYGLVCRASDQAAVRRLYTLKSREHKPGTIIAASLEQFETLGLSRRYLTAVTQFWPGPISVVVPSSPALNYLDQGTGTLAVRIPDHNQLRAVLEVTGPLLTSSANLPGQPSSTTIADARGYFGTSVDFYIDGGPKEGLGSTIIRVVDDHIEILRQGDGQVQ